MPIFQHHGSHLGEPIFMKIYIYLATINVHYDVHPNNGMGDMRNHEFSMAFGKTSTPVSPSNVFLPSSEIHYPMTGWWARATPS